MAPRLSLCLLPSPGLHLSLVKINLALHAMHLSAVTHPQVLLVLGPGSAAIPPTGRFRLLSRQRRLPIGGVLLL